MSGVSTESIACSWPSPSGSQDEHPCNRSQESQRDPTHDRAALRRATAGPQASALGGLRERHRPGIMVRMKTLLSIPVASHALAITMACVVTTSFVAAPPRAAANPQTTQKETALPAPEDVAAPPATAKKTASGLAYRVLKPGTGKKHPAATDAVKVDYTGWTTDGK